MLGRFTSRAQGALQRAQQIMFANQHTQLDVEHIFLALLQQRDGVPELIITSLGGDVEGITRRLELALKNMQTVTYSRDTTTGYITLRANRVIQRSAEQADRLGDDHIGTKHLLLAVVNEPGGATGRILAEAGLDSAKVEGALGTLDLPEDDDERPSAKRASPGRRELKLINPDALVKPVGFNYGILATGMQTLYLAGQTALDGEGNLVAGGDVVGQYRQVLANLQTVVVTAGGKMENIVKMTIFVQDRDDYKAHLKELGAVHKEFFGSYYPATALLEVSRFYDDGVLVEIEGIAVL